jgi:hypothetical protein
MIDMSVIEGLCVPTKHIFTTSIPKGFLLQPHFWKSVRMTLTLLKWGLGSPPGLPKFQSSIAGVKTPCLETFFMSLESY